MIREISFLFEEGKKNIDGNVKILEESNLSQNVSRSTLKECLRADFGRCTPDGADDPKATDTFLMVTVKRAAVP
jgi:hypothetical protein